MLHMRKGKSILSSFINIFEIYRLSVTNITSLLIWLKPSKRIKLDKVIKNKKDHQRMFKHWHSMNLVCRDTAAEEWFLLMSIWFQNCWLWEYNCDGNVQAAWSRFCSLKKAKSTAAEAFVRITSVFNKKSYRLIPANITNHANSQRILICCGKLLSRKKELKINSYLQTTSSLSFEFRSYVRTYVLILVYR